MEENQTRPVEQAVGEDARTDASMRSSASCQDAHNVEEDGPSYLDVGERMLTSEDFARMASNLWLTRERTSDNDDVNEVLAQDVEDYRAMAQLLSEKEATGQGENVNSLVTRHQESLAMDPSTSIAPPLVESTAVDPASSVLAASDPESFEIEAGVASDVPNSTDSTSVVHAELVDTRMEYFELEDNRESEPLLFATTSTDHERRLADAVRNEAQRIVDPIVGEIRHLASLLPRNHRHEQQDASDYSLRDGTLWRSVNSMSIKRCYLLIALPVFLFFLTMTSFLGASESPRPVAHEFYKRPPPKNHTQVPRSTLPYAPKLFGRGTKLRKLSEHLKKPGSMASIYGGAGVGKSHLATTFANEWIESSGSSNYQRFGFWIPAETESEVRRGYREMMSALGMHLNEGAEDYSTRDLASLIWNKLSKSFDFEWIIVFDNVPAVNPRSARRVWPYLLTGSFPCHSELGARVAFCSQHSHRNITPRQDSVR